MRVHMKLYDTRGLQHSDGHRIATNYVQPSKNHANGSHIKPQRLKSAILDHEIEAKDVYPNLDYLILLEVIENYIKIFYFKLTRSEYRYQKNIENPINTQKYMYDWADEVDNEFPLSAPSSPNSGKKIYTYNHLKYKAYIDEDRNMPPRKQQRPANGGEAGKKPNNATEEDTASTDNTANAKKAEKKRKRARRKKNGNQDDYSDMEEAGDGNTSEREQRFMNRQSRAGSPMPPPRRTTTATPTTTTSSTSTTASRLSTSSRPVLAQPNLTNLGNTSTLPTEAGTSGTTTSTTTQSGFLPEPRIESDLVTLDTTTTEAIAAFNRYAERMDNQATFGQDQSSPPPEPEGTPQPTPPPVPGTSTTDAHDQENDDVTRQGRDREAHRDLINRLNANNPLPSVPAPSTSRQPDRAPPEMTFEITMLDLSPIGDYYKDAAALLAEARKAEDRMRPVGWSLKFNSRKLRSQDWIVWALNQDTMTWLKAFFASEYFAPFYRASIVAERGQLVKYSIGVTAPDSMMYTHEEIIEELFKAMPRMGYYRFFDEQKRYKDEEDIKAHKEAKQKKKDYVGKGDYDKMIWVRMSQQAHETVMKNEHLLGIWVGVGCLDVTRLTDLPGETPMMGRRRKLGPRPENDSLMAELRERALEGAGNAPLAIQNMRPAASISSINIDQDQNDGDENYTDNADDEMESNNDRNNRNEQGIDAGDDDEATGETLNDPGRE